MTTITDTLTYIDGSLANGRLVVGWKPFTVGNVNAAGGELEWSIVDGAVSISLYSNTGAQPTGSYYVAKYELENGAVYLEQWMVPDLPTVNLGQVRVAFPPSPSVMISPLQLTSLGAAPGMFLMWNGQRWVPGYPGQFSFVDPTLVKGDIIVRGATAPATRLGVGTDGWTLIADSSQPLGIKWIAPVSGFADPTTTKGDLIVRGNAGTTRIGAGSNAFVLTADSALPLGLKWAAVPLSPQTPWTQDINGAGFTLYNVGKIGVGNNATDPVTAPGYPFIILGPQTSAATGVGIFTACSYATATSGAAVGAYAFANYAVSGADKRIAQITVSTDGAINSGVIGFNTSLAGTSTERMRITAAGNVGIGTAIPIGRLSVVSAGTWTPQSTVGMSGIGMVVIGPYGGGIGMIDGTNMLGMWGQGGDFYFGTGTISGALTGRMIIAATGNVGIGPSPIPTTTLELAEGTQPKLGFYSTGGNANQQRGALVYDGGQNTPGGGWTFQRRTDAGGFAANLVSIIVSTGRLGILTTSPGYPLDVVGDVNCSSGVFRVNGNPTPRITSYLDQTGARVLNTGVYQNTQGCPIFVSVTLTINAGQYAQLLTDLGNPPTNVICAQTNATGSTVNQTVNGWVMTSHYFKVTTPGATLIKWFEWA